MKLKTKTKSRKPGVLCAPSCFPAMCLHYDSEVDELEMNELEINSVFELEMKDPNSLA